MKNIYIYNNKNEESEALAKDLSQKLTESGFTVSSSYTPEAEFVISVGGDGAFLRTLQTIGYADIPILGINTGHLGFFTELDKTEADRVPELLISGNYLTKSQRTIKTVVETDTGKAVLDPAINDVLVRHWFSSLIHLNLCIGGSFVETFSGDGVLISTATGSTAYNYSLGGSIVDPHMEVLQLNPVAPANNKYYRSFVSSLILPPEQEITITPADNRNAILVADGRQYSFDDIKRITISLSENRVRIVRLPDYDFWGKVKSKFL